MASAMNIHSLIIVIPCGSQIFYAHPGVPQGGDRLKILYSQRTFQFIERIIRRPAVSRSCPAD
jgi:hypothetical protein